MEKLVNSFSRLRQSIFELDFDKFKQSILSIKDGLLALGSQMIAPFTKAASAIKGLILGTESLTVAMSALGKAVGLVGLTGLVGTVGFLVAHFDKLKDSGGLIGTIFNYLEKSIKSLEISMVSLLDSLGLVDFNKWFSEGGKKEMIDTKKQNEELYKQKENEYRRELNRENELFARDKARLDLEIRRAKLKDETGQKELKAQEELDRKTQQHLQRLLDIEKKRITETTKFLIQQQENPLPINIGGATKFFNEGRKIASERGLTPLFYWDMMERDLRTNYQTFLERLEKGEYDVEPERPNIRKPREYEKLKKTITDVVEKNRDIIQTELEKILVKVYESPATTLEQRKKDIVDAIKKNERLPKLLDVEAKDFSDRLFKFFDDTSLDISEAFNAAKDNLVIFEKESAMNLARLRGEIAQRARERRQKMMEGLEPLRSLPTEGPASAIIRGTEKPEDKAARLDETMKGIKEISDKRLKADKEGFDAAMEAADNQERIRREKEDAAIAYQKASAQEKLYYQQQIAFQGLSLANQVNDLIYQSDNQRATAQLELERKSAAFKAEARKKGLTEEQLYQQKLVETQNEVNRKQFNRNKALQIASAVVNTASAIAQINAQPLVNLCYRDWETDRKSVV